MLMKKNYFRLAAVALAMTAAQSTLAIDFPYAQELTDGQTYFLASRSNPTNYWTRTAWDGAYYLLPLADARQNLGVFTAHQSQDGYWYFSVANADDADTYVGIPAGTDNLNGNLSEPALWMPTSYSSTGTYQLQAGAGQGNELTIGGLLHLNSGNQYAVITESTNYWFPDFYGGVQRDENDLPLVDDNGFPYPLNPVSRNWAFISPDDLDAYSVKVELYALLQNVEDNYLALEGFAQGFQGLLDAALPYYNKETVTADDVAAAKVIVDAKMDLYKEIMNATDLYTKSGVVNSRFQEAIETATSTFNTTADVEQLAAALQALKDAEREFAENSGDLTPLVANNSFEDLSSQNGSQTTGVAGAPAGWNVYVRGQQVTTADEVRAAGITAWHGINNDAEGALDGDVAFGLWTSGVPEYEISQTLTGLENGSYTIQAALMVGANGSGSRRTTQRIFGNLNSRYFASQNMYDESRLDQNEVYSFEGLYEENTDRLLQEMTVRAFVYDGTLTLGLRTNGDFAAANREAANGAGGDGWFKLDNFRVYKEGYIQSDALDIYNHFLNACEDLQYEQMQLTVKAQLDDVLSVSVGTGSSQEEIIAAILALKNLYPQLKASVDLYTSLKNAIDRAAVAIFEYENSASADDFLDLLEEAEEMYDEAVAGEEEINEMIALIDAGIEELKATSVQLGDCTYALKNPSFEDLRNQNNSPSNGAEPAPYGWTLSVDGEEVSTIAGGWCAINRGDAIDVTDWEGNYYDHQYTDGEFLWGVWNDHVPNLELSQTLTKMPEGAYTLRVDVAVPNDWSGDNLTTQRIFGNDFVQMFGSEGYHEFNLPDDAKNARILTYAGYDCARNDGADNQQISALLRPMELHFDVKKDGICKIGFRTSAVGYEGEVDNARGRGWFKLDNFRLSFDSTERLSIEGISRQAESSVTRFYTVDGHLLQAPQRGINIMRVGDKAVKVMVK